MFTPHVPVSYENPEPERARRALETSSPFKIKDSSAACIVCGVHEEERVRSESVAVALVLRVPSNATENSQHEGPGFESARSPCAWMGFLRVLWFPPTSPRHVY